MGHRVHRHQVEKSLASFSEEPPQEVLLEKANRIAGCGNGDKEDEVVSASGKCFFKRQ